MRRFPGTVFAGLLIVCGSVMGAPSWSVAGNSLSDPAQPDPGSTHVAVNPPAGVGPVFPDKGSLGVILERPLFSENRRPVGATEASGPVPDNLVRLYLKGIVQKNDERFAIFSRPETRRTLLLTEGMSHNGWSLTKIADEHVEFRRGPELTRLSLDFSRPANVRQSARQQQTLPATTGAPSGDATLPANGESSGQETDAIDHETGMTSNTDSADRS